MEIMIVLMKIVEEVVAEVLAGMLILLFQEWMKKHKNNRK